MELEFEKYIKDYKEVKELKNALEYVFNRVEDDGNTLENNQYIKTANESVVREWEIYLDIPFDKTLTLEERKQVVLLRLFTKPPYTLNNIKRQIFSITGHEIPVRVNLDKMCLVVTLDNESKQYKKMIDLYLKGVLPINLYASVEYDYNTYDEIKAKGYTYNDLKQYTYKQIREDNTLVV